MRVIAFLLIVVLHLLAAAGFSYAEDDLSDHARKIANAAHQKQFEIVFPNEGKIEYLICQLSKSRTMVVICSSYSHKFIISMVDLENSRVNNSLVIENREMQLFSVFHISLFKSNFGGGFVHWHENRAIHVIKLDENGNKTSHFTIPWESSSIAFTEFSETELLLLASTGSRNVLLSRIQYDPRGRKQAKIFPPEFLARDVATPGRFAITTSGQQGACAWLMFRSENGKVSWDVSEIRVTLLHFKDDNIASEKHRLVGTLRPPNYGLPQGKLQVELITSGKAPVTKIEWIPSNDMTKPTTLKTTW